MEVFRFYYLIIKLYNYYIIKGKGDLKHLAPIIYSNLTKWETDYEESHAKDFTKEELIRLHEAPNTAQTLVWKAYSATATSNASRSGGNWKKDWKDIETLHTSNNNSNNDNNNSATTVYPTYKNLYITREKTRGKKRRDDKDAFITGYLETKVSK